MPCRDAALAESPDAVAGQALFEGLGCDTCHVGSITTAPAGTVINGGAFTVPDRPRRSARRAPRAAFEAPLASANFR